MKRNLQNRLAWRVLSGIVICLALPPPAHGAPSLPGLAEAAQAGAEGVPEVSVVRLREMLKLAGSDQDWRAIALQLVPALLAANEPDEALHLLDDARLKGAPSWNFWRGQSLAALHRWQEALPCFEASAANPASPLREDALFGQAEMLRALGRSDEALRRLAILARIPQWSIRARLRSADLLLDRSDWMGAERVLDDMNPASADERKERRFLRGRIDLVRHHSDRAAATFESLLKKSERASHAFILATLFGIADAHLQLKTPESGDDFWRILWIATRMTLIFPSSLPNWTNSIARNASRRGLSWRSGRVSRNNPDAPSLSGIAP